MTMTTRGSRLFPVDPFEMFSRDYGTAYGVDVREDADRLYLEAEMPGFKKDEVEIVLDKSVLTISARREDSRQPELTGPVGDSTPATNGTANANGNATAEPQGSQWLLRERSVREYKRAFRLPPTVDGASVEAKLEDGVLFLTLTKREETKPRKISVS